MSPSNDCEYKALRAHWLICWRKHCEKTQSDQLSDQDKHKVSLCNKRMKATLFSKVFSRAQTKDGEFQLPAEEF